VDDINVRTLVWAGHLIRMEDERIPGTVLNGKFHNKRSVGRSRIRWEDVVQSDALQILEIRGWMKRHGNREKWRCLVSEVRA